MAKDGFDNLAFIPDQEIREKADIYRETICPKQEIPLDIFTIIEFDLDIDIQPIPNLKTSADTETVLLSDFSTILVDRDDFMDDRFQNRMTFSIAHELGHIELHQRLIDDFFPDSVDEYIETLLKVSEIQYRRFEYQAYEFAGRLLVPRDKLVNELKKERDNIQRFLAEFPGPSDYLAAHVATNINGKFGVSSDVIEKRIDKEGIDLSEI
jgi:Zn-dependent peptidase ImmA (M78 family)